MFIGIDIGSRFLDVAASEAAPALPRRVPNTDDGIVRLVAALRQAARRPSESRKSACRVSIAWTPAALAASRVAERTQR